MIRLRETKIEHLRHLVLRQHDISALDIPVYDLFCMCSFERLGDLTYDAYHLLQWHRTLFDVVRQRNAIDVFHRDEGLLQGSRLRILPFPYRNCLVYLEYRRNIGMVKLSGGLRLTEEPYAIVLASQGGRRKHFKRDRPIKFGVSRFVNDTHAAATELGIDSVLGKRKACH